MYIDGIIVWLVTADKGILNIDIEHFILHWICNN